MIITNIGADKSRGDDQLTITSVVLSDFDFRNYGKNDIKQVIAIKGDNLQSVTPTVGLLSNGNAIVQTDVDTSFRPRSAFIFANNGRADFLLAIEEHLLGNLNATVSIDALHKVRFDAIANDIVTKDELKSLVTSEFNAIPKDDVPSYASDAYSRATNYADSNLASKANVTDLIPFAKQSDVNSQLAAKVNASDLSVYAKQSSVDSALNNKADISSLSQFAVQSSVDNKLANKADIATLSSYATNASVSSQLANKADTSQLSSYVTTDANNSATSSINNRLTSKADVYVLSDYAKSSDVNARLASKVDTSVLSAYVTTQVLTDASSQVNSALQTKANVADLSNYATSSALTSLSSDIYTQLTSKTDNVSLTSVATSLVNSANGNFNAIQSQSNSLESNIDLTPRPAIGNGTSLDTIVDTGMYPMNNVDLGSLPANLGLPHAVISGALIVRREFNLVQQTIKDNVGNIYVRNMGRAWSKFKTAEIDNVSRDEFNDLQSRLNKMEAKFDDFYVSQQLITTSVPSITTAYDQKTKIIALFGTTDVSKYSGEVIVDLSNLAAFYEKQGLNSIKIASSWLNFQQLSLRQDGNKLIFNASGSVNFTGCTVTLEVS